MGHRQSVCVADVDASLIASHWDALRTRVERHHRAGFQSPKVRAGIKIVLQLRVVLRSISPLTWRRLLVRSDTSIARRHQIPH
jgi:hypothetical protein